MSRRCFYCQRQIDEIEYTDPVALARFTTPWAKIKAASESRLCSSHQRQLAAAIKRARFLALLPYTKR